MADEDVKTAAPPPEVNEDAKPAAPSPETDDEKAARHRAELAALTSAHKERVARAHADHPTPPGVKFTRLGPADRRRYNRRRAAVDASAREYHLAIRAAVARHQDEGTNGHDVIARGMAAARVLTDYRGAREAVR